MKVSNSSFQVRSLTLSIFLPNLLFSIGRGAAIPVVALLALELGASPAMAGLVVALRGAGTMIFDLPAGFIVAKLGEKRAMALSGAAMAITSVGIWLRPSLLVYAGLTTLMGASWAVWLLARIAFAAGSSPLEYRGRVMAMIGGVSRVGHFIGPLLGSIIIVNTGVAEPFLLMAVMAAAGAVAIVRAKPTEFVAEPETVTQRGAIRDLFVQNRKILLTAGTVAVVAQILRSSREALIPLWGDEIGLSAATIALIFAASSAVESLIFYPAGLLMDRRGRKWMSVPSVGLLAAGVAMIPLTGGLQGLVAVALLMGLANGLGSGMNMTLGSDLSPLSGRSVFLGAWRLITDLGSTGGPLLVAVVTSTVSLAASAVAAGAVGLVGLFVLVKHVPETLHRA